MRLFNPTGKLLSCSQRPGNHKRAPEKDALLLKSLHSSRSLQSKRYEFFWNGIPLGYFQFLSAAAQLILRGEMGKLPLAGLRHSHFRLSLGDAHTGPSGTYLPKTRIKQGIVSVKAEI